MKLFSYVLFDSCKIFVFVFAPIGRCIVIEFPFKATGQYSNKQIYNCGSHNDIPSLNCISCLPNMTENSKPESD